MQCAFGAASILHTKTLVVYLPMQPRLILRVHVDQASTKCADMDGTARVGRNSAAPNGATVAMTEVTTAVLDARRAGAGVGEVRSWSPLHISNFGCKVILCSKVILVGASPSHAWHACVCTSSASRWELFVGGQDTCSRPSAEHMCWCLGIALSAESLNVSNCANVNGNDSCCCCA